MNISALGNTLNTSSMTFSFHAPPPTLTSLTEERSYFPHSGEALNRSQILGGMRNI